jgi:hypothetical protein
MAIITKTVGGYGPYAYRADYIEPEKTEWTYLGPVGQVDPAQLSNDEVDDLRDERILSVYRDTTNAEFASKIVANEVRDKLVDRYGADVLDPTDDRRTTLVQVSEDAPPAASRLAEQEARDDRDRAKTFGQADLTDAEKDRLDFSERPIFHAKASKAVIQNAGIDDWTSVYDSQVEDPAAFEEIAEQNRDSIQGERLDNETENVSISREEADSRLERRAIDGAEDGVDEAADQLREEFGYTDSQIEELQS